MRCRNAQEKFNQMNKSHYALGRPTTKNYANGLDAEARQFKNSKVVSIVEMLEQNGCRRNCYNYKVNLKKGEREILGTSLGTFLQEPHMKEIYTLFNTLTATRVVKEISVRPRVQQYQAFSARCSHRYFSNASCSSDGLKNDLSFRSFATLKPLAVVEYNEGKCGIDYSDQMVSYATTIRIGIKWYRKLYIQLLLGISVVNAVTVYKIATRKNINIRIFRQLLVAKLLSENTKDPCLRRSQHNIAVRKNDSGRSIRCACKLCYANKRRRMDQTKVLKNLKKTTTYCPSCPDQPQLCIKCFKVLHSK